MTDPNPRFDVSLTNEFVLTAAEIWPDGDAPENPTADDVLAQMKREGSVRRLLNNWDLWWGTEVAVTDENWETARWGEDG